MKRGEEKWERGVLQGAMGEEAGKKPLQLK